MNQCEKVATTPDYSNRPNLKRKLVEETEGEQAVEWCEGKWAGAGEGPDAEDEEGEVDDEREEAEEVVDAQRCFVEVDECASCGHSNDEQELKMK